MAHREQYERMMRRYARFTEINAGKVHTVPGDFYMDDIYSFFQDCYHLKDWIKNDPAVTATSKSQVENYISSKRSLCLCADLCNGAKHFKRTLSDRSKEDPKFGPKLFEVTMGPNPTVVSLKCQIDMQDGTNIDAFKLATECVADWEAFLKVESLL
jgi:hypothetical protein